jgi:hypothetical protein
MGTANPPIFVEVVVRTGFHAWGFQKRVGLGATTVEKNSLREDIL